MNFFRKKIAMVMGLWVASLYSMQPNDELSASLSFEVLDLTFQHEATRCTCPSIFIAIRKGHLSEVSRFIDSGCSVKMSDNGGNTLMHYAVSNNKVSIAQLLLKHGAPLHGISERGLNPLHMAASRGHVDCVKFLVDRGCDVSANTPSRWTPLHYAAFKGHRNVVEVLLSAGATTDSCAIIAEMHKFTPLHLAAQAGHEEIVRLLLNIIPKFNSPHFTQGHTPLHDAAQNGHTAIVRLLIDKIDYQAPCLAGFTPLHLAAEGGHNAVVELLLQSGARVDEKTRQDDLTPLHLAAKGTTPHHHQALATLLKSGAFPLSVSRRGASPLFEAIRSCSLGNVRHLLNVENDLNRGALVGGYSHLHEALSAHEIKYEHTVRIVISLLDAGADCLVKSGGAQTPLELSLLESNLLTSYLLIGAGAVFADREKSALGILIKEREVFACLLAIDALLKEPLTEEILGALKRIYKENPIFLLFDCGEPPLYNVDEEYVSWEILLLLLGRVSDDCQYLGNFYKELCQTDAQRAREVAFRALTFAVSRGDACAVSTIISFIVPKIPEKNDLQKLGNLLKYAVMNEHWHVVEILLRAGAPTERAQKYIEIITRERTLDYPAKLVMRWKYTLAELFGCDANSRLFLVSPDIKAHILAHFLVTDFPKWEVWVAARLDVTASQNSPDDAATQSNSREEAHDVCPGSSLLSRVSLLFQGL